MNLYIFILIAFTLMLIQERKKPAHEDSGAALWWPRAIIFNIVQAFISFLATISWDQWLPEHHLGDIHQWAIPLQVITGYLVITFIYYWWHRVRHTHSGLWRWLHQLHHSPARLELITSFYKHPLEIMVNGLLSSFILYTLLGTSPIAATLAVGLTGIAELFYHWNIRTPYWLGFIVQRPESHRVHHQRGRHCNNYSDLPVWDMLFGTFENPRHTNFDCGFQPHQEQRLTDMLLGRDVLSN